MTFMIQSNYYRQMKSIDFHCARLSTSYNQSSSIFFRSTQYLTTFNTQHFFLQSSCLCSTLRFSSSSIKWSSFFSSLTIRSLLWVSLTRLASFSNSSQHKSLSKHNNTLMLCKMISDFWHDRWYDLSRNCSDSLSMMKVSLRITSSQRASSSTSSYWVV